MLTCRDVAREASDYIDHAQPWHRRWRMAFHIFICFYCRRFLRHLRVTRATTQQRGAEPASPQEVAQIVEHVCNHP